MSSLDIENIYTVLRNIVDTRIGDELSKVGTQTSIFQARSGFTKAKSPYVTLDIVSINDRNAFITNLKNNADGSVTYETHKSIPIVIQVRDSKGRAYQIANKLHKVFTFDTVRDKLYEDLSAVIIDTSNVDRVPDVLSTKYVEFCTFTVTLGMNDIEVDNTLGYITEVEQPTGGLTPP